MLAAAMLVPPDGQPQAALSCPNGTYIEGGVIAYLSLELIFKEERKQKLTRQNPHILKC